MGKLDSFGRPAPSRAPNQPSNKAGTYLRFSSGSFTRARILRPLAKLRAGASHQVACIVDVDS
jgi:hypothetical protein